jgi:hypothetical protein
VEAAVAEGRTEADGVCDDEDEEDGASADFECVW